MSRILGMFLDYVGWGCGRVIGRIPGSLVWTSSIFRDASFGGIFFFFIVCCFVFSPQLRIFMILKISFNYFCKRFFVFVLEI